jgi:tetratricopeptide (TPR) repeat protein
MAEAATDEERDEWAREHMYHLLAADLEQGFELFTDMFSKARSFYQLSTCALLLELAEEQEAHLSAEDRLWLRFGQGQLAEALAQWSEAPRIFEGLWREELPPSLEGTLANDLGLLYQARGKWEWAIEYCERSLAIEEKVGDEHGMAPTLNNLGTVYKDKGEWERAIEYYGRSLAILEKVGDEVGAATTMYNIASLYEDMDRYDETVELLERVVEIDELVGIQTWKATGRRWRGAI